MMPSRFVPLAFALSVIACGDDGGGAADAAIDGPPDPCAPAMTFTGEYITWDSSATSFMGIFGATFTHRDDPGATDMTAPNGRFEMCIPAADGFVDVTPMAGSELVAGTVVVDRDVLSLLPIQSYRSFTTMRAADFGFDAGLAHVFVHVAGDPRSVTTASAPAVQKVFDGTMWSDGTTGTDIYLGNIDVGGGTTTLVVTGGNAVGGGSIPLTAGSFTYVTLIAR